MSTMLAAAFVSSFFRFDENRDLKFLTKAELLSTSLFGDRLSIVAAADDIADACVRDAADMDVPRDARPLNIDLNSITPKALLAAAQQAVDAESKNAAANPVASLTPDQRSRTKMIVYVYGEPALMFHLNQTGVIVSPVSHLNLRDPGNLPPTIPTFVVFGPNAKRTPGFWEQLMQRADHFRPVATMEYAPSQVTLLDMFDPRWLREHPEAMMQTLEVHRVE
ncbi:MAG: hypothetical protein WKF77_09860 [Planctomycetaceae bacterium]